MSFVAEDGTGIANANSYASVAAADAYFSDRGVSAWAGSGTVKEQALVRATDYIERMFGKRFIGVPYTDTQALSFPRVITDEDLLPKNLVYACCEYALRALTATLFPDPKPDSSGFPLKMKKTVVGPIESTFQYASEFSKSSYQYPSADKLLSGLVTSNTLVRM